MQISILPFTFLTHNYHARRIFIEINQTEG